LEKYAQEVGLDVAKWKTDKDSDEAKKVVDDDARIAQQFGVRGTPNFFINGRPLQGAQPYEKFAEIVKEEVAHADEVLKRPGVQPLRLYAEIIKNGKTSPSAPAGQAAGQQPNRPRPPMPDDKTVYKVEIGNSPVKGPKDALITIAEFSEFQ